MLVHEPDNPESIIFNTVTPPNFVDLNGEDFTQMEGLKALTDLGPGAGFDEAKAKEYRDKAGKSCWLQVLRCLSRRS